MEKNICRKIQLPGSRPSDSDFHITRWGHKTMDELWDNMCGRDVFDEVKIKSGSEVSAISPTSELKCLLPYKSEPKQKSIKLYFIVKEKDYIIAPLPLQCEQCVLSDPYEASTSNA